MSIIFYIGMRSDIYGPVWFKLCKVIDTTVLDILILVLCELDLDTRSQGCWRAKTSAPINAESSQKIWMEFGVLLRPVCVINLIFVFI